MSSAERLHPEAGGEVVLEPLPVEDDRLAEATRIEDQLTPVVELEPGPHVTRLRRGLVKPRTAERLGLHQVGHGSVAGLAQQEVAGHPQVDGEGPLAVELDQQVLAAAADGLDRATRYRPRQPAAPPAW